MPVFVFLSGYFTSEQADIAKQKRWIKATLMLYLIAQLGHFVFRAGCDYFIASHNNTAYNIPLFTWKNIVIPYHSMWYLQCLIYWRVVAWNLYRKLNDTTWIIVSILLSLASGFIPIDTEFSFQRAFVFFPFFMLGMIFRIRGEMLRIYKVPYLYAIIGLVIGILIVRYLPIFIPKRHYTTLLQPIIRMLQSVMGIYICLLVIRVLRVNFVEKFSKFGAHTMWIYIGQSYSSMAAILLFPVFGVSLNLISSLVLTCLCCAVFIVLNCIWKRLTESRRT